MVVPYRIIATLLTIVVILHFVLGKPLSISRDASGPRLAIKILSGESGRFLTVSKSQRVNARASKLRKGMVFFPTYPQPGSIQLESARFPGNFLTILNGTLLVEIPSLQQADDVLRVIPILHTEMVALEDSIGCYVGFNRLGKAKGVCDLSIDDNAVRLTLMEVSVAELTKLGLQMNR